MRDHTIDYADILRRLKAFDLDAYAELYVHARERLYAYAFSILKNEDTAQDVVQELFADFWENQLYLQVHTRLAAYLVRAVRNRSLDYKQKEHNRARLREAHFGAGEENTGTDAVEAWALGEEIEAAINRLPPMPAKVFRLHYIEKLSYAEIAEQLQISVHTVGNHMSKALKDLRMGLRKI